MLFVGQLGLVAVGVFVVDVVVVVVSVGGGVAVVVSVGGGVVALVLLFCLLIDGSCCCQLDVTVLLALVSLVVFLLSCMT